MVATQRFFVIFTQKPWRNDSQFDEHIFQWVVQPPTSIFSLLRGISQLMMDEDGDKEEEEANDDDYDCYYDHNDDSGIYGSWKS